MKVEKQLIVEMKGKLTDINNLCQDIGNLTNDYPDIEVDFR